MNYAKVEKLKRICLHLIFWSVAYLFFVMFYGRANRNYDTTIAFATAIFPLAIITTYFINYYLIPNYLLKKRYLKFAVISIYTVIISIWIETLILLGVFIYIGNYKIQDMDPSSVDVLFLIVGLYFIIIAAISFKMIRGISQTQQHNLDIELKLKEAELKLLKAQINPHFLFNTLNNLYGLTLERSSKASGLVLNLSEMMDYMLYRSDKHFAPLSEELALISNYIEIERVRYSERLNLELLIGEYNKQLYIAPLIILPFVENAFKHGVNRSTGDSYIKIDIQSVADSFTLKIINSQSVYVENISSSNGVGLVNVRQRLQLIYPDAHTLDIDDNRDSFSIFLTINLTRNEL